MEEEEERGGGEEAARERWDGTQEERHAHTHTNTKWIACIPPTPTHTHKPMRAFVQRSMEVRKCGIGSWLLLRSVAITFSTERGFTSSILKLRMASAASVVRMCIPPCLMRVFLLVAFAVCPLCRPLWCELLWCELLCDDDTLLRSRMRPFPLPWCRTRFANPLLAEEV